MQLLCAVRSYIHTSDIDYQFVVLETFQIVIATVGMYWNKNIHTYARNNVKYSNTKLVTCIYCIWYYWSIYSKSRQVCLSAGTCTYNCHVWCIWWGIMEHIKIWAVSHVNSMIYGVYAYKQYIYYYHTTECSRQTEPQSYWLRRSYLVGYRYVHNSGIPYIVIIKLPW